MARGRATWRWAAVPPSIPIFPGLGVSPYAFLPLLIFLFWWSWLTFYLAIGAMVFFVALAKIGYTYSGFMAWIKHKLRGPRIHARPWWYRKRFAPPSWYAIGRRRSELTYDNDDRSDA